MKVGQHVRDNLTGLRGVIVRTDSGGLVVNRSPHSDTADTRHYTWSAAYAPFVPGHRRLEVIS